MEGRIANIVTSFIEIPGKICSSIYFSGCPFKCSGCQNPDLQNIDNGTLISSDEIIGNINENLLATWVCFLGGEPFYQSDFLYHLCHQITKPIGIYSGYDFNVLQNKYKHIIDLPNVKFLKAGKFMIHLLNDIEFPITSNQKVYLKKENTWIECQYRDISLISNEIILL